MQFIILLISVLFLLFLPGFFLSLIFFRWGAIEHIERLLLSFALSLTVVPLVTFYGNLVGITISAPAILLEISGMLILIGIIFFIQQRRQQQ